MVARRMAILVVIGCGLAFAAAWWTARHDLSTRNVDHLAAGVAYAVETRNGEAIFDVNFRRGQQYFLVVSTFGDPETRHSLHLAAEPVEEPTRLPVCRLTALPETTLPETAAPAPSNRSQLRANAVPTSPRRGNQPLSRPRNPSRAQPLKTRRFSLHTTNGPLNDPRHYAQVESRLIAEGRHVRVYLDNQRQPDQLAPGLAKATVRLLDREVLPLLRNHLGDYRDVDRDGKLTVLLTPWLNHLQGGQTSLGAFVRSSDFRRDRPRPFSNQCDMLYLNASLEPGPHLRTLLRHELTHAICFSQRLPGQDDWLGRPREADWINEGMAHVCETLGSPTWSNLDYRISRYLNAPEKYPLLVEDYYRAGLWRNHGCRGAAYLFLQWCVNRYGKNLLRELVDSPLRGTRNLERATGRSFGELYRRWSLSLLRANRQSHREQRPYQPLDLRGRLAEWTLAGPHCRLWNPNSGPRQVQLRGTATAFFKLRTNGPGGVHRLRLTTQSKAWQVSLLPCRFDWPTVAIRAGWAHAATTRPVQGQNGARRRRLNVHLEAQGESRMQIEAISCEWNRGQLHRALSFSGDRLRQCRRNLSSYGNGFRAAYQLPLQYPQAEGRGLLDVPLVVKVVARDAQGRRTTAWQKVRWNETHSLPARLTAARNMQAARSSR